MYCCDVTGDMIVHFIPAASIILQTACAPFSDSAVVLIGITTSSDLPVAAVYLATLALAFVKSNLSVPFGW
ncbi:unannotated protein [freshwater metagenome]|uniref:Unannotated protein n=1 Tax=freshwater metagenome TaxID=449393 RepID=A0A6J6UQG2_9ZZZZ